MTTAKHLRNRTAAPAGRPRGSVKTRPSADAFAILVAIECWEKALQVAPDGELAIDAFLKAYEELQIGGQASVLVPIVRLLQRVMDVDLSKATNRKGAIPEALGLVSRRKGVARDLAVIWAFDRVREREVSPGGEFVLSEADAYQVTAEAFNAVPAIGTKLTARAVEKIVQRTRAE